MARVRGVTLMTCYVTSRQKADPGNDPGSSDPGSWTLCSSSRASIYPGSESPGLFPGSAFWREVTSHVINVTPRTLAMTQCTLLCFPLRHC